jgi:hypothetical protein
MPGAVEKLHYFNLNSYDACKTFTVVRVAANGSSVLDRSEAYVQDWLTTYSTLVYERRHEVILKITQSNCYKYR